ncbi:lipopolysaccharide biosynthesis protein [Qipengyuania sp. MTN3-11]|uniref:lipopolysaccharide biosynthesis protein n=1 Tax=Qipengyuania sp. MTN3-11 TaxID=3056557 RepID=UPI0036F24E9D
METGERLTDAAPEGFAQRVRSALAWRYGGQVAAQLITWSSTILVVRLLDPADYGLFAMSQVVVTALAFLNGYGFAGALIQADSIDERDIGQAFGLLLLTNTALAIAQFLLAPLAADYFGQPLLTDILRLQVLLFLVVPFIALPDALLARKISFRFQALASMSGAITGAATALGMAWFGYGVWALVVAPILAFGARAVVLVLAAKLRNRPRFGFRGAGAMIGFGGAMIACQFFWIVQSQADIVIAGRRFEIHDLGLYSEALFLALIVTGRFLPPINEVAFPAYSELHKAGRSLAPYFERVLRSVALITAPIYVGLALTAPEAVLTLFGEKWAEMAPIAQGLALAMPFFALQIVCSPTTNAMGQPRIYVMTSACGAAIFVTCFAFGAAYGPMGLVHAWWVAAPMLLAVTLALTLPRIGMAPSRLVAALAPAAIACGVMALAVTSVSALLPADPPWARLLVMVPVGAVAYVATIWFGWRDMVRDSWAMLRNRAPQPPAASGPTPAGRTSTTAD